MSFKGFKDILLYSLIEIVFYLYEYLLKHDVIQNYPNNKVKKLIAHFVSNNYNRFYRIITRNKDKNPHMGAK